MNGIQYVVDDAGEKTAVVIDLRKYGQLWEDFCDRLVSMRSSKEPRESLSSVKARLARMGKLNG